MVRQEHGNKAHDPTRPNPQKKQVIKNGRLKNNPRHKKPKMHDRTYRTISRTWQVHERVKKVKHAQDSDTTSLYLANIGSDGLWVRGHGLAVRRRKKPILEFLLKLFWGECSTGMTCHPKEVRMSWNHQVHAMKDREKEHTHCNS